MKKSLDKWLEITLVPKMFFLESLDDSWAGLRRVAVAPGLALWAKLGAVPPGRDVPGPDLQQPKRRKSRESPSADSKEFWDVVGDFVYPRRRNIEYWSSRGFWTIGIVSESDYIASNRPFLFESSIVY